jgi:hypothetical protein
MEIHTFKKRNELGLKDGVEYTFKPDGLVDWASLIPKDQLFINKAYENQIVEKLGKPITEITIDEVDEKYRLATLAGIRHVANLRGYSKVEYSRPVYGADGAVAVECKITWLPNYETEMREVVFSGLGEATKNNAAPIGKNKFGEWAFYLVAIAENRAFLRAAKIFLGLGSLLTREECAVTEVVENSPASAPSIFPKEKLQNKLKAKKISFEIMKKTVISTYRKNVKSDPTEWESIDDIPNEDIFEILGLLQKQD